MKDHLNGTTVLLTTAVEDADEITKLLEGRGARVLHLPLERYVGLEPDEQVDEAFDRLEEFENIIYGHKRNAVFMIQQLEERNQMEEARQRLNLALDEPTAQLLEEHGIPAVQPGPEARPIQMVEFMLRLRRMGATLYPCGTNRKEEIPGLLQELDIAVNEMTLYEMGGPESDELSSFRQKLDEQKPGIVIFHSRSAVNRTQAAFPELDLSETIVVSTSAGVTEKLEENDITVRVEGRGTWKSTVDLLAEYLLPEE